MGNKDNISKQILNLTTPYCDEFVRGKYSVYSFGGDFDSERYIIGEHINEGKGVFFSYNITAVPIRVPEERLTKLIGEHSNEMLFENLCNIISSKLLENNYWEVVDSSLFEDIDSIDMKITDLLEVLGDMQTDEYLLS